MAHEPQIWMKGQRRTQNNAGGMHIYIDEDSLRYALEPLEIPLNAELEYARYAMKDKNKRYAQVLIKIREKKII